MNKDNQERNSRRSAKEQIRKKRLRNRVLLILGVAVTILLAVAIIIFMVRLHQVNVLPTDYKVMGGILLGLVWVIVAITQRWVAPGIVSKVIGILLSVILIVGSVYINITYSAISKISGQKTKTTVMGVYVLTESKAETIEDVADETFGILGLQDRTYTDDVVSQIKEKLGKEIATTEYDNMYTLVDALYDGSVSVIILNSSYAGILSETDGYDDFEERVRLLTSYEKIENVEIDSEEEVNEDVVTLYISGVDVEGSPNVNRNSDVNIILVINKKTKQVLLLNTPRDYYVLVARDGGVMDKLTHAGVVGVDCSIDTLEDLYDIRIDGYLKVNFTGFKQIIDALGGVNVWSEYEFTSYHGKFHFTKGYNYMTGEQALGFARERYSFGSGDNQRGRNQMEVIKAIIEKVESTDMLLNYQAVLESIADSMVTSLTYEEITELIQFQINEMPTWDINIHAVSGTGGEDYCYALGGNNYVMYPNEEDVEAAKTYLYNIQHNIEIDVKY